MKIIGIVGGVGPYAGLDLNRKIFDSTIAANDQAHLEVYLLSRSAAIPDRTVYLLNESQHNPAIEIALTIKKLASIGAQVIGIPCNTSHSPQIFKDVKAQIDPNLILLNMVEEVGLYIKNKQQSKVICGLLSTLGTYSSRVYEQTLQGFGLEVIAPQEQDKQLVHEAIYNKDYGIKAFSNPVKDQAKQQIESVMQKLTKAGAQVIILGCTELSLVFKHSANIIDSNLVLARALINKACPERLKKDE